jgi:AraC-like DNA-binding protein
VHRQGEAFLTCPGESVQMSARSKVWYLCFDVVDRQRRYRERPGGRVHVEVDEGAPVQPSWERVAAQSAPTAFDDAHFVSLSKLIVGPLAEYSRSWEHLNETNASLQIWLVGVIRSLAQGSETATASWQERAVSTLETMARAGASVADVAKAMSLSRAQFYRKYVDTTRENPGDALARIRLATGRKALVTTTYSIQSVARMAGFSDASAFSRRFRQVHGITPSQWRRLHS